MRFKLLAAAVLVGMVCLSVRALSIKPWSTQIADSIMQRSPQGWDIEKRPGATQGPWSYSTAFAVYAVGQVGVEQNQPKYVEYVRNYMNAFIDESGAITTKTYVASHFKLDDVAPGRAVLQLYEQTKEPRWMKAADQLAAQFKDQPRTQDGGFWHKDIYKHQMWLDGIFMDCPFMAQYGKLKNEPRWFDEAAHQIITIHNHTRDAKTGLYYHGWDASKSEKWANKETGLSECIWGRAVGWYIMGIVETLENLPKDHPRRSEIVKILSDLADAVGKVQDAQSGVWYQVLDQPTREGNYLESSASAMFVFALAKGVRLGVLDAKHLAIARKGYDGMIKQFIEVDHATGLHNLKDTCRVAGLGGNPKYRDGSFEYYMSEARISNDPKGLAPFILASLEMERLPK